jgi:hypothetical protein
MIRLSLIAVAVALALSSSSTTAAQPISPHNPYRSFNISGVNYGSQQWERAHRGNRGHYHYRSHRLFLRRR